MISVKKCRELLSKECSLTDSELESLRDQLYALADISTTAFAERRREQKITYDQGRDKSA